MDPRIQELLDKQALHELLMRYCRAIDRGDAEILRSVYHPDAVEDHGPYKGGIDGFIAWVLPRQEQNDVTMHHVTNVLFELDGDLAFGEHRFLATHFRKPREGDGEAHQMRASSGRYLDRYERRDDEWRIARRQVLVEWNERRPVVVGFPLDDWGWGLSRRDASDPSYANRPARAP